MDLLILFPEKMSCVSIVKIQFFKCFMLTGEMVGNAGCSTSRRSFKMALPFLGWISTDVEVIPVVLSFNNLTLVQLIHSGLRSGISKGLRTKTVYRLAVNSCQTIRLKEVVGFFVFHQVHLGEDFVPGIFCDVCCSLNVSDGCGNCIQACKWKYPYGWCSDLRMPDSACVHNAPPTYSTAVYL